MVSRVISDVTIFHRPLAMAFLDRLVDGAIILKIKGKCCRAHRAKQPTKTPKAADK